MDERITANEWNKRRECPICRDIADHKVNLEGEIVTDDKTGEAVPCPQCGHRDTRIFHSVGGVESREVFNEEEIPDLESLDYSQVHELLV